MPHRRSVLTLIASLAGQPRAAGPAAARVAAPPMPAVRRYGRHVIVNGWVLTRADLAALKLDDL
jgi:hypothetical protein